MSASLNPTLVAAATVMLLLDRPAKLLWARYGHHEHHVRTCDRLHTVELASTTNPTENTLCPAVEIALEGLALAAAFVLYSVCRTSLSRQRCINWSWDAIMPGCEQISA